MLTPMTDIGAIIKAVVGLAPQTVSSTSDTLNGDAIDRTGFDSAVLQVMEGAQSATEDVTVDAKLQESADGSTGWSDIDGAATAQIAVSDDSVNSEYVDVNLRGVKQYIRAVVETTESTGTATVPVAASVILGGARDMPAA